MYRRVRLVLQRVFLRPLFILILACRASWAAFAQTTGLSVEQLPPAFQQVDQRVLSSGLYLFLAKRTGQVLWPAEPPLHDRLATAPLAAPSSEHISANIQLGSDPSQLPTARRAQAEPHIDRNPFFPNLLAATFQEGRFESGGAVTCGYAISTDAGITWNRGLIPKLSAPLGDGPYDLVSDPVAAIDNDGSIYLNTLGGTLRNDDLLGTLIVSRSTNGGLTFNDPVVAFHSDDPTRFPDKNWMAVNTFSGTSTAGRLVVTFTFIESNNVRLAAVHSDDQGDTWSSPVYYASGLFQGTQPVFLPDGSLVILFRDVSSGAIRSVASTDGGNTFSALNPALPARLYDDPIARDASFLLSAAAGRESTHVYITYQELVSGVPRIRFAKSGNSGASWSTPVSVNDTPNSASVFNPALAVSPDGQHLVIIFYDKRHDTPGQGFLVDLYAAESFDCGATWESNTRLSTVSSDLRKTPMTPSGYMLGDYQAVVPPLNFDLPAVAVWIDTRNVSPDPFAVRVDRRRGTTFAVWQALHFLPAELNSGGPGELHADPDLDQMPNFAEYVFGTDPRGPLPAPLAVTALPGGTLELVYSRSAVLSDAAFSWQATTNLLGWSATVPLTETIRSNFPIWREQVRAAFAPEIPHEFFRLELRPVF